MLCFRTVIITVSAVTGQTLLPAEVSGARLVPFPTVDTYAGQGVYPATGPFVFSGEWQEQTVSAAELGAEQDLLLKTSLQPGASYELSFNGQSVKVMYSRCPSMVGVHTP